MEFIPAVAMLALIVKLIDFARYARSGDLNGVVTQLVTWVAGAGVFLLVAQTAWADGIVIGSTPLSKLGVWSLVFAGVSLASGSSFAFDIKKALTKNDSSALPTLLPPRSALVKPATPAKQVPPRKTGRTVTSTK